MRIEEASVWLLFQEESRMQMRHHLDAHFIHGVLWLTIAASQRIPS